MRMTLLASLVAAALMPSAANADGNTTLSPYVLTSTSYSQDFDTLANSGTSDSLPAGFQIFEFGTNGNGSYAAGTGSSNAGNSYSFGAAASSERALGSVGSGSNAPIHLGGVFTNGLSATITSITLAFTGEQWRDATSTNDGLFFSYLPGATNVGTGSWTTLTTLDFLPVVIGNAGAIDGNSNSAAVGATISGLAIAPGETFGFRWTDLNSGGNDHGLAIDDLRLTATVATAAVPEPATWAMMIAGFGLAGATLRARARRTRAVA
jgi:hypothetical protein